MGRIALEEGFSLALVVVGARRGEVGGEGEDVVTGWGIVKGWGKDNVKVIKAVAFGGEECNRGNLEVFGEDFEGVKGVGARTDKEGRGCGGGKARKEARKVNGEVQAIEEEREGFAPTCGIGAGKEVVGETEAICECSGLVFVAGFTISEDERMHGRKTPF